MSTITSSFTRHRQQMWRSLAGCIAALLISVIFFLHFGDTLAAIVKMHGMNFFLASSLFGLALALAPITALVAYILFVWHGSKGSRIRVLDKGFKAAPYSVALLGFGVINSFVPSLAMLAYGLNCIHLGEIAFRQPARVYKLASDPIAFWQSTGLLFIIALCLAYPAWRYWFNWYQLYRLNKNAR